MNQRIHHSLPSKFWLSASAFILQYMEVTTLFASRWHHLVAILSSDRQNTHQREDHAAVIIRILSVGPSLLNKEDTLDLDASLSIIYNNIHFLYIPHPDSRFRLAIPRPRPLR